MKKDAFQFSIFFRTMNQTNVATVKYGAIVIFSVLILFISALSLALAGEIPDYSALTTAIEAAYHARTDLLSNSTGMANLVLEKKELTGEAAKKLEEEFAKEFSIGLEGIRFTGKGTWTTTWYKKGLKNRYDVNVPPSEEKDLTRRPFLIQKNLHVAVDPEKGIYYDELHKEAYINRPPTRASNPLGLVNNFDIHRLYQFNGRDLPDLIAAHAKVELQAQCSEEYIGQTRCIKLEFYLEKLSPEGKKVKKRLELWVAPEMSYSLLKAQFYSTPKFSGEEPEPVLVESYEATYQESDEFKGIWLLKDVRIVDNRIKPLSETLTATFHNTKVGVEIPDETFTFEGLGVPPGTKIYDKSLGGQPLQYYYKSFPVGKVDELAGEILNQEEKKDKGKLEKTVAEEAVPDISPVQEQTKPDPTSETVAQVTKSTNSVSYLWILYCVLTIAIIAIIVAVYRVNLKRK